MPVKTKKKPTNSPDTKFKAIMLVSIYRCAKLGMAENDIADYIGISVTTWKRWKRKFTSVSEALEMGRTQDKDGEDWHKFVFDRLSPDLRDLWNKLCEWDELPNGVSRIEALLETHGKAVRQQLYIYALVHSNFSASRAMCKVNIDKDTLDQWIEKDPHFAELVDEIQWHKGNFFEENLVALVAAGDRAATIFANRSFNDSRGYGVKNKLDVDVRGQVDHSLLDLAELELRDETRIEILNAIRQREERIQAERTRKEAPVELRVLECLTNKIGNVEN